MSIYLFDERLKWAKMFPDEFYIQLSRLKMWDYNPLSVKRPKIVGKITNELVSKNFPRAFCLSLKSLIRLKIRGRIGERRHTISIYPSILGKMT